MTIPSSSPLRVIARDRSARRLALAYGIFNGAEYAVWVTLIVYAYRRGGASESGLVALTQLLPAAAAAPIVGVLSQRRAPEHMLAMGYWIQGTALGCAALTVAIDGPPLIVYGFMLVMSIAITTTRPAQALVTPRLAKSPNELTALNVVTEWTAQGAIFVAPAIAGAMLTVSSFASVFATFSAALIIGAVAVSGLSGPVTPIPTGESASVWSQILGAARLASRDRAIRLVLLLGGVSFVVVGALDVMIVVLVIEQLHGTVSEAAWMTAALGAGGIVGAGASTLLIGRRLAPALGTAAFGIGVSLTLVGFIPGQAAAYALLFAAGLGQAVFAVAGHSLLQRCCPTDSVGRIFALFESFATFGLAIGAIAAPAMISGLGTDSAFILVGLALPVTVACTIRSLWRLDDAANVPIVELLLLRSLPIFLHLPPPALEGLARNATPVDFPAGTLLMSQGEPGDRYLAIAQGDAEVVRNGLVIAHRSRGEGVGEIALLRRVPRTATVRAQTAVRAFAIERHDFLVAVLGHDATPVSADRISAAIADGVDEFSDSPNP